MPDSIDNKPCHSSPSLADGCNRIPFASGDGCDRGSVDIRQFDDLPLCKPIDPTMPEIPPEVLDTPWVLPVPPPCACVDIEFKLDFKGYTDRWWYDSRFKSKGDCCEGEYEENLDFELPCPIDQIEPKTIRAEIGWGHGSDECGPFEQTYIQNSESCGLDPSDIDMSLCLPCPMPEGGEGGLNLALEWNADSTGSATVVRTSSEDDCALDMEVGDVTVGLPCPVKSDGPSQVQVSIGYGDGFSDPQTKTVAEADEEECGLELPQLTEFDLEIPCALDHLHINGSVQQGDKWNMEVLTQPGADECSRDFHILLTYPKSMPSGDSSSSESSSSSSESSSSSGSSSGPSSHEECYCTTVTVKYKTPHDPGPDENTYTVCGPEGTYERIETLYRGSMYVKRLDDGNWTVESYNSDIISSVSLTCGADSSSSSSGSSSSHGSSGGGSSGGGSSGGGSSPSSECIDVISGDISFELTEEGVCITYTKVRICGSFKIDESKTEVTQCVPVAGHVNKCCDSGGDTAEGAETEGN